jgi:hypothetical protein
MKVERYFHFPFISTFTINQVAHWATVFMVNPLTHTHTDTCACTCAHTHTHTSVLILAATTTTLPTNRLYFPCWYTGPDPFVTSKSTYDELEFIRTTFKQNGYSDQQIQWALSPLEESPQPQRNLSLLLSCLLLAWPSSGSGGPGTTSNLWAYPLRNIISFL